MLCTSVWSCRCVWLFFFSPAQKNLNVWVSGGAMCAKTKQNALTTKMLCISSWAVIWTKLLTERGRRRVGTKNPKNISLYSLTSLLVPCLCCGFRGGHSRTSVMCKPWHQPCTGASPASLLSVPWEQLGRISVSVAAYKSLMEVCALERRSYELSSGSLILTHAVLYATHWCRHTQHRVWWKDSW